VSGLVRRDGRFALEHADRGAGIALRQLARDGQPDDAAADDREVGLLGRPPALWLLDRHGFEL
jgi:hypothetical protein